MAIDPDDYCRICGEDKFANVGFEKVPLCIDHFIEWLLDRKESLRRLTKM